ncbi:FtsQ-type POTRA domain-containing protein [archaeon]|nr:MAG: FtsQ-type POTRA domain-containing protein [archaeon]
MRRLRLRQHPWIARATIRRQLPDTLHIQVHNVSMAHVVVTHIL